jgi:hypothetical protein
MAQYRVKNETYHSQRYLQCILLTSLGIFTLLTWLYLGIIPGEINWANFGEDGGEFLTAILTGGIPHPTGYPTYILLGILFQKIPMGTPYFRAALISVLSSALAGAGIAALYCLMAPGRNSGNLIGGLIAGLSWGISPLVWSQAINVEVYGLNSLFIVISLLTAYVSIYHRGRKIQTIGLISGAALFGLGLGNHLSLLLFIPVIGGVLGFNISRGLPLKVLLISFIAFLCGLIVYVYLPIRALTYPPLNWGNPQTLKGFLWEISGNPYQALVLSVPAPEILNRLNELIRFGAIQYGYAGFGLALIGGLYYSLQKRTFFWLFIYLLLVFSIFSIGYNTKDWLVYLIPTLISLSIWLGWLCTRLWDLNFKVIPYGRLLSFVFLGTVLMQIPTTLHQLDPRNDHRAKNYALTVLNNAPYRAILLTQYDRDTFSLWYYHFGVGYRPDLILIVEPLTQFPWYQESLIKTQTSVQFPGVSKEGDFTWIDATLQQNLDRPHCRTQIPENLVGSFLNCY